MGLLLMRPWYPGGNGTPYNVSVDFSIPGICIHTGNLVKVLKGDIGNLNHMHCAGPGTFALCYCLRLAPLCKALCRMTLLDACDQCQ